MHTYKIARRNNGTRINDCSSTEVLASIKRPGVFSAVLLLLSLLVQAQAASKLSSQDCLAEPIRILTKADPSIPAHARAIWRDASELFWIEAPAASKYVLVSSPTIALKLVIGKPLLAGATQQLELTPISTPSKSELKYFGKEGLWFVAPAQAKLDDSAQNLVLALDDQGRVIAATHIQPALRFDERFQAAQSNSLGLEFDLPNKARFSVYAPSVQQLALCLHDGKAPRLVSMTKDNRTGIWATALANVAANARYRYVLDVYMRGHGLVRNLVSDPYATSLTTDGVFSTVTNLQASDTQPDGWISNAPEAVQNTRGKALQFATDMSIYELHVRDFSIGDNSVSASNRGKYLAFTEFNSNGMQHLRALAEAGITDVHLLPVFDIASVPEQDCLSPNKIASTPTAARDWVKQNRAKDCFNWGYDPQHFGAPEGSYASDANDGAVRVREFRAMVQALHQIGLRVGMDVVYNHTAVSGLDVKANLDRIVPDYYHRLDANGAIERSTCCENTATEHRMMEKLMIDTAVRWVRDYRIDSFRFDLMGHQPKDAMLRLQKAVDAGAGRYIPIIGEGWNFGEIANNARFVQASQNELGGSGIATFSDRMRDAARGGGCCDSGADLIKNQGFLTGLSYDPNQANKANENSTAEQLNSLRKAKKMLQAGLAGTLQNYVLEGVKLRDLEYAGGPAGYVQQPNEVVNYVENHDNPTLFDIAALKLPIATSSVERARVQMLGVALVMLAQGIPYSHAGVELLRSKSLDRNSYDSGDFFNRLDWTFKDNGLGVEQNLALPPTDNPARDDAVNQPVLEQLQNSVSSADIAWMRAVFFDWLKIRSSQPLLRLTSAAAIQKQLVFYQTPDTVIAAKIDANDELAITQKLVYLINVDIKPQRVVISELANLPLYLHPVLTDAEQKDLRIKQAKFNKKKGEFMVPARSALVYLLTKAPR